MRPILMRHDPAPAPAEARIWPPPVDHHRFDWGGGVFETAWRPFTTLVEGSLVSRAPVLMVTLHGGADRHEVETDGGQRHVAPDAAGSISFLPAGSVRRLRLHNVAWQWASLTLPLDDDEHGLDGRYPPRAFSAARDELVRAALGEMARLHAAERHLDATYCDAMALALTHHVARRYWRVEGSGRRAGPEGLPAWRLRRVIEHVQAHLADELRIATLASLVGLSAGHFQRAFRATTGRTPLAHITHCRVEAAKRLLATGDAPVSTIAAEVGFGSPSHFARTFRAATGLSPGDYRRAFRRP
jgi:AraC family transcriptional regulator